MKYLKILTVLVSFALTACAGLNTRLQTNSTVSATPAKLLTYSIDEKFVHIDVISNGCTLITSFELMLVDKTNNSIQVMRKKPDTCIVKPIKVSLDYAYRHLGIDDSRPIQIVNPAIISEVADLNEG